MRASFSRAAAGKTRRTGTGRSPSHTVVVTLPASAVPMKSFAAATGTPERARASRRWRASAAYILRDRADRLTVVWRPDSRSRTRR